MFTFTDTIMVPIKIILKLHLTWLFYLNPAWELSIKNNLCFAYNYGQNFTAEIAVSFANSEHNANQ